MASRALLLFCLAAATATVSGADTFDWKSRFTKTSSRELAALHESIDASHLESLRAHPVSNLVWSEQDFTLEMKSGTLYLEPPVGGVTIGAFFEGHGVIRFTPNDPTARNSLKRLMGMETLESVAVDTAYLYSLRADAPFDAFATAGGEIARPANPGVYEGDKSALRQLGLDLTENFLNREGPALGQPTFSSR